VVSFYELAQEFGSMEFICLEVLTIGPRGALDNFELLEERLNKLCKPKGYPRVRTKRPKMFARTPKRLARFVCTRVPSSKKFCCDIMAGDGQLTKFLPMGSKAFELDADRAERGVERVSKADWKSVKFSVTSF